MDATSLIVGGLVGALLSLIFTLVGVPLFQDRTEALLVRIFGKFAPRRKQTLAGKWSERWWEDGREADMHEGADVEITQLGNRVVAVFPAMQRSYRLIGRVDRDLYVSGTWQDEYAGATYHGVFQLRIFPNAQHMEGRWVGFSRTNKIKTGTWQCKRSDIAEYK